QSGWAEGLAPGGGPLPKKARRYRLTLLGSLNTAMTPTDFIAALERASTRRTTPLGAGEIVWNTWGHGKPLLLLHGGTGSWMHWIRNVDVLARDAMVVVPDLPGSGDSSNPAPPISAASI